MATKKRYSRKTYQVYGNDPLGNHYLTLAMRNDYNLYNYVSKNHKALSKMPKDKAIRIIKGHVSENWARQDLRSVNSRNVHAGLLKKELRDFNK